LLKDLLVNFNEDMWENSSSELKNSLS